ncbi:MAG: protein kinase [Synergistaceae bacterium]|nr:protein kinase [Synergistaceae bacterium]
MTDIKQYEPLWGSWYVEGNPLGEGSFGQVWKVRREEFDRKYYAAVKIISLPQSREDLNRIRSELNDDEPSVRSYFKGMVDDIIQEIDLMSMFRGNSNVVSIEDHKVLPKEGGEGWESIGWDILIRMELLETLSAHTASKPLTLEEVMRLGIDISHALELCAVKNVIHRDIKPDNIFVSEYGDYKLGDFGVARHIERMNAEMSEKGTPTYMAPEIFNHQPYGPSVDLYSLGIVMYRYLNNNRAPFMPPYPEQPTPDDRENALMRRMRGEQIPDIPGIPAELNDFVLKACAFRPDDRFRSAEEFRKELERIAGVKSKASVYEIPRAQGGADTSPRARRADEEEEHTVGQFVPRYEETIIAPKNEKPEVPARIMNFISIPGAVCSGLLTLLCIFSGRTGDIVFSMPLYAMLAALCVLTFKLSALNLVAIVWLIVWLAFTALMNFSAFDYPLLAMTVGILCAEALRSPNPKYKRVLSVALAMCAVVTSVLSYRASGASTSENFKALIAASYGIPAILSFGAVAVMLPHREDGKVIPVLAALQFAPLMMFLMMIAAAFAGKFSYVLFNMANACLVGFSPERFSWWRYARFLGLVIQVVAALCVVLTACARMMPSDFLAMMNSKGKSAGMFAAGLAVVIMGLLAVLLI